MKKMFDSSTFCTLPFTSIQIHPSGNFKVCCFSGHKASHAIAIDDNGKPMNIMTHDIGDAVNSKLHKELRLAMSQNKRHDICGVCWMRDDAANQSYRLNRNSVFSKYDGITNPSIAELSMNADGSIASDNLLALDIRFGNLCNAKCIHCFPMYSNAWYEDHVKLYGNSSFSLGDGISYNIYTKDGVFKSPMSDSKWWESERWWQQFDSIKDKLKLIYVTGGEPFLVPAHDEMLDRLISADLSKNIDLEYDSNLSALNPKILSKLSKFKSASISASFEDIEDRFELIRYPLKFGKIVENLKLIEKYGVKVSEISSCLGIYTAFAPTRMMPFFDDLGFNKLRFRLLRMPELFDLRHLHPTQKQKIITRYQNSNVGIKNSRLITGYLNNTMNEWSESKLKDFVKHMNRLDKIRGTDWKSVMPDVVDLVYDYV